MRVWVRVLVLPAIFAIVAVVGCESTTVPARRLKVALFAGRTAQNRGTAGFGAHEWARRLANSPDVELKVVDGADLRAGVLGGMDAIVVPGGGGLGITNDMGDEGMEKMRSFIHDGGGCIGTCAGIAVLLNENVLNRIKLLPYQRTLERHRGGGYPKFRFNARAAELLGIPEGDVRIRYHMGPILRPAAAVPGVKCETLATLEDDLDPHADDTGPARGTPAAVFATYGRGRIFAINCHPETAPGTVKILEGAFKAVCGRRVSLALPEKAPDAKHTPFVCNDFTKESAAKVIALDRDPAVFLRPSTKRLRAVLWGVVHNHARGKLDAMKKLKDDFEVVGYVDDSASKAMRMTEPDVKRYAKELTCFSPREVFENVRPDVIVVECSNSELVETSLPLAEAGYPMHMDKPLGTDAAGFKAMSDVCRRRNLPLQIGYMFRANEAINFAVKTAHDGVLGEVFGIDADLNHSYGGGKYPEYASAYPGGTAYLLTCHAIEWAMPIFDDVMPLRTYSIIKAAPGHPDDAPTHTLTIVEWEKCLATFRVCAKGTQPCRHIRIDGTNGTLEIEPIEDFRKVKHTTGLADDGLSRVDALNVRIFLKEAKGGYRAGINNVSFKAPDDRYAGQLKELAEILRGERPNPPGLYEHDLKVHRVSLDACRTSGE